MCISKKKNLVEYGLMTLLCWLMLAGDLPCKLMQSFAMCIFILSEADVCVLTLIRYFGHIINSQD